MPFTFNCQGSCPKCGAGHFVSPYQPAEFAPVTCMSCGEITTVKVAVNAVDELEVPDSAAKLVAATKQRA